MRRRHACDSVTLDSSQELTRVNTTQGGETGPAMSGSSCADGG
jgi:hypothetical protein